MLVLNPERLLQVQYTHLLVVVFGRSAGIIDSHFTTNEGHLVVESALRKGLAIVGVVIHLLELAHLLIEGLFRLRVGVVGLGRGVLVGHHGLVLRRVII